MEKRTWILRIAALLLCLTCLTTSMVAGLYARYTTTSGGSSAARVAKFEVIEAGQYVVPINADVFPGCAVPYTFLVTNASEVSVNCKVEVENKYENLPLEVKLYDGATDVTDTGALIGPNTAEHEYTVKITWPTGSGSPDPLRDPSYAGMVDLLLVTLTATQID